jgi:hypothetical protein
MRVLVAAAALGLSASGMASPDDLACVSTTFNLLSPNDKVVSATSTIPRCRASLASSRGPAKADGASRLVSTRILPTSPLPAVKPDRSQPTSRSCQRGRRPSARRPAFSSRRHASTESPMRNGISQLVEPTMPEAGHLACPVDQGGQGAELRAVVRLATFVAVADESRPLQDAEML